MTPHNLDALLARYAPITLADHENALKEIVQEIALLGLWRAKFYEHAAFYGGTALRVFHGLSRFSEDLDFSLIAPDDSFRLDPFLSAVHDELISFGFQFEVGRKIKSIDTAIESAFIKGGTQINLLRIGAPAYLSEKMPKLQQVRVKLEIDTQPPLHAGFEVRTQLLPIPFQVRLYNLPSLMAGKLHAVLCRDWKGRVKGRDWYDLIWYAARGVRCNLDHLAARMQQSGHRPESTPLTLAELRQRLQVRIAAVDFTAARQDVQPFIRDASDLTLWSRDFFREIAERITQT
ncbi:MAG: nucleotidyl transferase AbiEii/AbiGii toxin family protein [Prosthecobacter sp.]|uniref:nucleotidyl transferase AbiEii/AbiGii toxin family protein n=1 Tax=Prosthecobacter sp. TaxID=1965333 RepID=UPI003903D1BF